jgi:hypothetical protein
MKEKKVRKDYVNNVDFLEALIEHTKNCHETNQKDLPEPMLPSYIAECFMKIAEGLSHKPNFMNYTYRDEMISDGIENCLMYYRNFNPDKSKNPFAYFTQIIYYAFLRRIHKEKTHQYIKYKSATKFGFDAEQEMLEFGDNGVQFEIYDNLSKFIETFEKVLENKKVIVKKQKGLDKFIDTEEEIVLANLDIV